MNKEILSNPDDVPQETPEQKAMSEQLRKIAEDQERLDSPKSLKDFDASIDRLVTGQPGETKEEAARRDAKLTELHDERDKRYESLLSSLNGKKLPKGVQAPITERGKIDESWKDAVKKWALTEKVLPDERFPDDRFAEFLKKRREAEYQIEEAITSSTDSEKGKKKEDETDVKANERQQNKIIKILETGNMDVLDQSVVKVNAKERTSVLEKISSEEINEDALRKVVRAVQPAYKQEGFKDKLGEIQDRRNQKYGLHEYSLVTRYICIFDKPDERKSALERWKSFDEPGEKRPTFNTGFQQIIESCPTIDLLQDKIGDLVIEAQDRLKNPRLSAKERDALKTNLTFCKQLQGIDFDEFAEIVYGKQKEYWDQIKLLKQEARGQ